MRKPKRRLVVIIILLLAFFGVFGILGALQALSALNTTKKAVNSFQTEDLETTKKLFQDAQRGFSRSQLTLRVLTPLRLIPFFGWYIGDAQRGIAAANSGLKAGVTMVDAVAPYADILGLKGEGNFLGGTAQERIASIVETLSKVTPTLDDVAKDLGESQNQIEGIGTWKYPNFLPGRPGEKLTTAKNTLTQVETFIVDAKPLIEVLPEIMGNTKEKEYIILLLNEAEIRPTGGFITAYSYFKVNKGNITSDGSEDIYKLDASLTKKVAAPAPIAKYLPSEQFLNIRDSNLSPDFYASTKQFEELYEFTPSKKTHDGVIAVNTNFVLNMMKVLGPIEALGTKFTTEEVDVCACPQIIYELEKYADEPVAFEKGDRKGIIGVLMQQMMAKTFEAPKSTWPDILTTMLTSLKNKDIIIYLKDAKSQQAVERVNFAGRIYEYDGDYLHINEANFGGAKSNMYIEQKIKQTVKEDKDNNLAKKLTIEYKYPRRGDNCSLERSGGLCLAGIYRSWIRVYVPKGSTLTKGTGTDVAPITQSEDLNKTVFEGFFTVRPEGTAKIEIEYTTPLKLDGNYKLLIQKQPGILRQTLELDAFGKKQRAFPLETDKEFSIKI